MAEKFSKKQEKLKFNGLLEDEKDLYYKQAERLHNIGFFLDRNVFELAEEIYDANWRNK